MLKRGSLLLLALVVFGGCGEPASNPPIDGGTQGAGGTQDGGGTQGAGGADAGLKGPGFRGVLKDEGEQLLGNVPVLACTSAVCFFGQSGADGRFAFPIDPPAGVAVKTQEDLVTTPRRAAALVPVQIVDMSLVDIGTVHVPNLPVGAPIGPVSSDPQTLMAGDGLELTVRRADLTPALGHVLDNLAARAIPAAHLHPLPALGAEQVVAVYALHPFAATSKSPIAVRAPSSLPAGTAVSFRTISEIDGHLSKAIHGQSDGAFVATDAAVGIDELTWLVISR